MIAAVIGFSSGMFAAHAAHAAPKPVAPKPATPKPALKREEPSASSMSLAINQPSLVTTQLKTPVDGADVAALEALPGVRIVGYLGEGRYLLWISATARGSAERSLNEPDGPPPIEPYSPPMHGAGPDAASEYLVLYLVDRVSAEGTFDELRDDGLLRGDADLGLLRAAVVERSAVSPSDLSGYPDLVSVESFTPPKLQDERQGMIIAGSRSASGSGPGSAGYRQWLRGRGFSANAARYPVIDIVDDGVDNGSAVAPNHPDFRAFGMPSGASRIVFNDDLTSDDDSSGLDGHGTINGSIAIGFGSSTTGKQDERGFDYGLGLSPFGRIGSTKTFANNGEWGASLDFDDMALRSYRLGARISSNSWGDGETRGGYGFLANVYDHLVRDSSSDAGAQPMTFVFAAGNMGPDRGSVTDPGTAKNVITVGASENRRPDAGFDGCGMGPGDADDVRDMAGFSGRGPTDDGRIKPEVVAPGTRITGAASQTPFFTGTSVCGASVGSRFYPLGQTLYTWSTGTSHSTPAVAGVASLVHEYFVRKTGSAPSPALVRAVLVNGARYLNGDGAGDRLPSHAQGFGAVDLLRLTDSAPKFHRNESSVLTGSGDLDSFRFVTKNPRRPVRVTLTWTDPAGTPGARRTLVNDLDLEVVADGKTYRGNAFSRTTRRFSQAGAASSRRDSRNNVEAVFLPAGTTGRIDIRVKAKDIAGDGAVGLPGSARAKDVTDQDYALAAYNVARSERLSLKRSTWVLRWGSSARLSGKLLEKNGTPIKSGRVWVHQRTKTGVWHALKSDLTDSSGTYALTVRPGADRYYRAFYWGGPAVSAAASTPAPIRVRPRVSLSASAAGSGAARFSGRVAPNHGGRSMYLQYRKRSSARWVFAKKLRLDSRSAFAASFKPARRGSYVFRVKLPAHGDHASAVSPQRTVTLR